MCGIVGLLVKREGLREKLGEWMVPMLIGMTERGPDSSGMAVFTHPVTEDQRKLSLYCLSPSFDWNELHTRITRAFGEINLQVRVNHAVMTSCADPEEVRTWLHGAFPSIHVLSVGRSIDLYKDVGLPAEVAQRYDFAHVTGTHLVGHTRMATESAVTPQNAHPYTAGEDWCLVHNGSLANPGMLRRKLEKLGSRFESDCDTEGACRYLHWRLGQGEALETALHHAFEDFDGFFTLLMGNANRGYCLF